MRFGMDKNQYIERLYKAPFFKHFNTNFQEHQDNQKIKTATKKLKQHNYNLYIQKKFIALIILIAQVQFMLLRKEKKNEKRKNSINLNKC